MSIRRTIAAAAFVAAALPTLPLHAAPPSPPVFWAGCAGALAVKAERSGNNRAVNANLAPMIRRALAQAKVAANPERLTPAQINGVAVSASRSFRTQLARNPGQTAAFDRAVKLCMDSVAKLPK
ncbi:MAG TPA: hypothetical protein VGB48_03670 [Allosphingosinicella sp.]|jgi:hypothetical protein